MRVCEWEQRFRAWDDTGSRRDVWRINRLDRAVCVVPVVRLLLMAAVLDVGTRTGFVPCDGLRQYRRHQTKGTPYRMRRKLSWL